MDEREGTSHRKLRVEQIRQLLDTDIFGRRERLVYLSSVGSTNTEAMMLARAGSEEGVVVLTDSQTAGKGRQGRHWVDVAGCNILSSTVLRPLFPPYLLIMVASLAVTESIAATCDIAATIKWPNDILIEKRKVSGILIETSHDHKGNLITIMGIGINVNGQISRFIELPQTIHDAAITATTLEQECGHPVSREALLANLLRSIETNYLALQQEARDSTSLSNGSISRLLREQWRSQLSTLGHTVTVRQGDQLLSGVAEDVNEHGELLLRTHSGERIGITWGDVWINSPR